MFLSGWSEGWIAFIKTIQSQMEWTGYFSVCFSTTNIIWNWYILHGEFLILSTCPSNSFIWYFFMSSLTFVVILIFILCEICYACFIQLLLFLPSLTVFSNCFIFLHDICAWKRYLPVIFNFHPLFWHLPKFCFKAYRARAPVFLNLKRDTDLYK